MGVAAAAQAKRAACLANTVKDLKFYGGVLLWITSVVLIVRRLSLVARRSSPLPQEPLCCTGMNCGPGDASKL